LPVAQNSRINGFGWNPVQISSPDFQCEQYHEMISGEAFSPNERPWVRSLLREAGSKKMSKNPPNRGGNSPGPANALKPCYSSGGYVDTTRSQFTTDAREARNPYHRRIFFFFFFFFFSPPPPPRRTAGLILDSASPVTENVKQFWSKFSDSRLAGEPRHLKMRVYGPRPGVSGHIGLLTCEATRGSLHGPVPFSLGPAGLPRISKPLRIRNREMIPVVG